MTPDRWKSLIQHVKIHFEDHYWSNDGLYEELVDEFIIRVEMNWMSLMIRINLIVLMTISSRHSQSSYFVKRFFQNHGGLIAASNRKRRYLVIVIIIVIVILENLFI